MLSVNNFVYSNSTANSPKLTNVISIFRVSWKVIFSLETVICVDFIYFIELLFEQPMRALVDQSTLATYHGHYRKKGITLISEYLISFVSSKE